MPENRDYDYVVGKLPRKDKDGKDTSGDKIGKGGRHRDDGTFSSMPYDLEIVDEDPTLPVAPPPPKVIVKREYVEVERRPVRYEDLSVGQQIIVDGVSRLLDGLFDYATDRITKGIENWYDNRRRKKEEERLAQRREALRKPDPESTILTKREAINREEISSEVVSAEQTVSIQVPDEFESAYKQFSIDMTSEEAQKELLDAFVFYVLSAKKVWRVSHARITDSSGKIMDGQKMVEKLSNPSLLKSINSVLENNPALLEEWQSIALSGILGRNVIEEERFIPISSTALKRALMSDLSQE